MIKYADIALNIPFKSEETLTYQIPIDMTNLKVGCRVEFELRNKKMEGLVIAIHFNMPTFELKTIKRQIDKEPIINAEQIQLAYWMRDFYVSSLGESLYKMIPSGRKNQLSEPSPLGSPELLKLNDEQSLSYENIKSTIGKESIHLLYGITGSGKTEVYIHLFHHILTETEKSAILLVPEISLTFQILHRLELIFGKQLALIHSNLRVSERFKNYLQLLRGEKRIVIGTRSAIFAPVKNLGLIIMDEEHDMSYKEHSSPRYHARQVAQQRIKMNHATLVLGSATPSLESFYHAKKGLINLHSLSKRAKNSVLSTVNVVQKKEDKELIGEDLLFKIKQRLDKKEQVILLLNRRGYSPLIYNKKDKKFLECPNCTSNLCFHNKGKVICHLCGYTDKFLKLQKENFDNLELMGAGTQKLEEYLLEKFPGVRLERLDQDSTKNREVISQTISKLINKELDILTGTQMIAKGLDAPGVTLVGVVNAASGLGLPDFRAGERVFSLLTQVAGRAGRGELKGEVVIETQNTDHRILQLSKDQNYDKFYEEEIQIRKSLGFPPFVRLIRIVSRSPKEEKAKEVIEKISEILKEFLKEEKIPSTYILGPVECPFYRIDSNFRYHILIKSNEQNKFRDLIRKKIITLSGSQVYLEIDIDPVDLV